MQLSDLLILGLASATISVTVVQSKAFAWLRDLLKSLQLVGELVSCPYCFGHYAALCLVLLWYDNLTLTYGFVAWLATTAISALVSGGISFLFTGGKSNVD